MTRRSPLFNPGSLLLIPLLILLTFPACAPVVNLPAGYSAAAVLDRDRFITTDGVSLSVRTWGLSEKPVTAVIVALHGFNDYSNFFAMPGSYLKQHGIVSYAYDQRGFGASPGRGFWSGTEAYTGDLSRFVSLVRKRHPGVPLYVLGESMGGAVAITALAGTAPPDADGVILVAPAVWARHTMPWYQRWLLAVASYTLPWMELTGNGVKVIPSDNREMLRSLARDPLVIKSTRIDAVYGLSNLMDEALAQSDRVRVPILVLYGRNDQIIPVEPTLLMLAKMPATTRKGFYGNGFHMLLRDLQGEKPLADIVAWIGDRSAPLPNGSDTW